LNNTYDINTKSSSTYLLLHPENGAQRFPLIIIQFIVMKTKFYVCPLCGNIVVKVKDGGVTPHCCGQEMDELFPKTTEEYSDKHLPIVECVDDCTLQVRIGSIPHPMTKEHHIEFIYVETLHGGQLRYLSSDGKCTKDAVAEFCNCKDPVVAVYEYCNIHGLWKVNVNKQSCEKSSKRRCC